MIALIYKKKGKVVLESNYDPFEDSEEEEKRVSRRRRKSDYDNDWWSETKKRRPKPRVKKERVPRAKKERESKPRPRKRVESLTSGSETSPHEKKIRKKQQQKVANAILDPLKLFEHQKKFEGKIPTLKKRPVSKSIPALTAIGSPIDASALSQNACDYRKSLPNMPIPSNTSSGLGASQYFSHKFNGFNNLNKSQTTGSDNDGNEKEGQDVAAISMGKVNNSYFDNCPSLNSLITEANNKQSNQSYYQATLRKSDIPPPPQEYTCPSNKSDYLSAFNQFIEQHKPMMKDYNSSELSTKLEPQTDTSEVQLENVILNNQNNQNVVNNNNIGVVNNTLPPMCNGTNQNVKIEFESNVVVKHEMKENFNGQWHSNDGSLSIISHTGDNNLSTIGQWLSNDNNINNVTLAKLLNHNFAVPVSSSITDSTPSATAPSTNIPVLHNNSNTISLNQPTTILNNANTLQMNDMMQNNNDQTNITALIKTDPRPRKPRTYGPKKPTGKMLEMILNGEPIPVKKAVNRKPRPRKAPEMVETIVNGETVYVPKIANRKPRPRKVPEMVEMIVNGEKVSVPKVVNRKPRPRKPPVMVEMIVNGETITVPKVVNRKPRPPKVSSMLKEILCSEKAPEYRTAAPAMFSETAPILNGVIPAADLNEINAFVFNGKAASILNDEATPVLNNEIVPVLNNTISHVLNGEIAPVLNGETAITLNVQTTPVLNGGNTSVFNGDIVLTANDAIPPVKKVPNRKPRPRKAPEMIETIVNGETVLVKKVANRKPRPPKAPQMIETIVNGETVYVKKVVNRKPRPRKKPVILETILNSEPQPVFNGETSLLNISTSATINDVISFVVNGGTSVIENGETPVVVNVETPSITNLVMNSVKLPVLSNGTPSVKKVVNRKPRPRKAPEMVEMTVNGETVSVPKVVNRKPRPRKAPEMVEMVVNGETITVPKVVTRKPRPPKAKPKPETILNGETTPIKKVVNRKPRPPKVPKVILETLPNVVESKYKPLPPPFVPSSMNILEIEPKIVSFDSSLHNKVSENNLKNTDSQLHQLLINQSPKLLKTPPVRKPRINKSKISPTITNTDTTTITSSLHEMQNPATATAVAAMTMLSNTQFCPPLQPTTTTTEFLSQPAEILPQLQPFPPYSSAEEGFLPTSTSLPPATSLIQNLNNNNSNISTSSNINSNNIISTTTATDSNNTTTTTYSYNVIDSTAQQALNNYNEILLSYANNISNTNDFIISNDEIDSTISIENDKNSLFSALQHTDNRITMAAMDEN